MKVSVIRHSPEQILSHGFTYTIISHEFMYIYFLHIHTEVPTYLGILLQPHAAFQFSTTNRIIQHPATKHLFMIRTLNLYRSSPCTAEAAQTQAHPYEHWEAPAARK